MIKLGVYSNKGLKKGNIAFPKDLVELENLPLLAQAIYVYEARSHIGFPKVKTRSEINKSKRKIYSQKGTGGARHGSRKAPIFVGGGVAHGPKGIKRELSLNKKMAKISLRISLTKKAANNEIQVVSNLKALNKTKDLANLLVKLGISDKKALLVVGEEFAKLARIGRNIQQLSVSEFRNLNAYKVFYGGKIILAEDLIK
ncbi:MAG: 50S ribosomal protein L4 [Patescibacteria group bacterium]